MIKYLQRLPTNVLKQVLLTVYVKQGHVCMGPMTDQNILYGGDNSWIWLVWFWSGLAEPIMHHESEYTLCAVKMLGTTKHGWLNSVILEWITSKQIHMARKNGGTRWASVRRRVQGSLDEQSRRVQIPSRDPTSTFPCMLVATYGPSTLVTCTRLWVLSSSMHLGAGVEWVEYTVN